MDHLRHLFFRLCLDEMGMDAAADIREERRSAVLHRTHKGNGILFTLDLQLSVQFAVDLMLHPHVMDDAACSYDGSELLSCRLPVVTADEYAKAGFFLFFQIIPARRRDDIHPLGAKERHVPHDDLPAHAALFRKIHPAQPVICLLQLFFDIGSASCVIHSHPSFFSIVTDSLQRKNDRAPLYRFSVL